MNLFIVTPTVSVNKDCRKVVASHQMEGIKLPLIVELGVDPVHCKPVIMSITPAIKLGMYLRPTVLHVDHTAYKR